MSFKIIVARYNEDIEWLSDQLDNCFIYNKGLPLNIKNEIMLDNVGRESETYLNYIINNYDNLPDILIFTQANISDHRKINDINILLNLKKEAIILDKSYPHIHFQSPFNQPWDKEWNFKNNIFYLKDNYKNNEPIIFIDWFKKHINLEYPNPINIYTNGIFSVKKELILNRSLEYYKNLILQLNHHINPAEGHFFERSWYYIFQ